ncbi:hypothetical protein ACSV5S_00360 [Agrobacterium deltaense]|uniref:hypothetical protein n=1 Tax=Agrobacterium deltaense TaxID=1183412 RepID=UPI003FCFB9D3
MEFNIVVLMFNNEDRWTDLQSTDHPFLADKAFFVAEIPINATLVFLIFATPHNREFCDGRNDRCWRKAEARYDIQHQKTLKPITATSEGGPLERMPDFHSTGGTISRTSFSTSNKKPLAACAGGVLNNTEINLNSASTSLRRSWR